MWQVVALPFSAHTCSSFEMVSGLTRGRVASAAAGDESAQLGQAVLSGVGLDDVLPALEAHDVDIVNGGMYLIGLHAVDDHGLVMNVDELTGDILLVAPRFAACQYDNSVAVSILRVGADEDGPVVINWGGTCHQCFYGGLKYSGYALQLLLGNIVFSRLNFRNGRAGLVSHCVCQLLLRHLQFKPPLADICTHRHGDSSRPIDVYIINQH